MNLLPRDGLVTQQESFLDSQASRDAFVRLRDHLTWRCEQIQLFNKLVTCPRLVSWYGDAGLVYRYAGNDHRARGWHDAISAIREKVEHSLRQRFNFVLCNRYRNGADYMGWHDDGERALGDNPLIASVSLGATRRFELKHKRCALKESIQLSPGSLLVMSGCTQRYWKHRLPRERSCRAERINLSFRIIRGDRVRGAVW